MATISSDIRKNHVAALPCWAEGGEFKTTQVNGLNLRYLDVGQGQPLVLLHTIRSQLDYFQKLIPELAKHYRVYALDLPAHGHSDIPDLAYDKPMFVGFVTGFIRSLGLENVSLMGESIGASISLSIAAEKKVTVKQVIALNPAEYEHSNGLDRSSMLGKLLFSCITLPMLGYMIANGENPIILRKVFEGGFNDKSQLPRHFITEMSKQGKRQGYAKAFRSIFLNWQTWTNKLELYADIEAPVRLIYSDNDWSLRSEREANRQRIPSAELVILPDCGHFSALENPRDILSAIL
ncbi:alpha/beta fold hydrolase [Agaribacterium sp. ZY112]|uniref:alpha/beta fold hydrolase n=1 Tax=Agaribacterium sp. ZY112 TaxID=3233574 RepID=UPI003523B480